MELTYNYCFKVSHSCVRFSPKISRSIPPKILLPSFFLVGMFPSFRKNETTAGLFTYGSNKNSQLGHEETDITEVEGLEAVRHVALGAFHSACVPGRY